jgi:hypothetical protein
MKIFIEKVLNEGGKPNGELWIESNAMCYQVIHYSENNVKVKGIETDEKSVISSAYYYTVSGCATNILNRKIKESTANDLKGLREDFLELEAWIHEKVGF